MKTFREFLKEAKEKSHDEVMKKKDFPQVKQVLKI